MNNIIINTHNEGLIVEFILYLIMEFVTKKEISINNALITRLVMENTISLAKYVNVTTYVVIPSFDDNCNCVNINI